MAASYGEFAEKHRGEHRSAFICWAAVIGNYSLLPTAAAILLRRPRPAAAIFAVGSAALVVGHLAEGNLPQAGQDLVRHPVWSVRAEFAVANATIRQVRSPRIAA